MTTIGLISALPQERDALLRYINGWKRIAKGSFPWIHFDICGKSCVLVTSGMGVRRAAEATQTLITNYTPQILISFGIAGAVETDLQVGDVVTPEAACRLEGGVPRPRLPLATWAEASREASAQALFRRGARLFTGTAITTSGSSVPENQLGNLMHPILEMETAGIALVAAENGIPLFSLRAISDGPQSPLPFDLGEMLDEDANLMVGRFLKSIVRHPRILFQVRRMLHNSRLAADHAAIALLAAVNQLSF